MSKIVILGVFVADTAYRAVRQPNIGETILGKSFSLGPGGKGSNQAVAAGMLGSSVAFVSRLGKDAFATIAYATWKRAGVTPVITEDEESYTGAAFIFVDDTTGNNAIIISPGAAARISVSDVEARAALIRSAAVAVTQLEQPLEAASRFLEIARSGGAKTILNPAPAAPLPDDILRLCDFLTPNETEAETLTGIRISSLDDAHQSAEVMLSRGIGAAVITLGERGVLYHSRTETVHVPVFNAGPVVETTGAGDAFNGGFAAALSEGLSAVDAVRFGCATASISVTRPGAASAMPTRKEVQRLLGG
jgi:ribokinase